MFNEYDEFDLAIALYHWLQHNWEGQSDELYSAFCTLTAPGMFRAGLSDEYFDKIDENALTVYHELTVQNYRQALDRVTGYTPIDE